MEVGSEIWGKIIDVLVYVGSTVAVLSGAGAIIYKWFNKKVTDVVTVAVQAPLNKYIEEVTKISDRLEEYIAQQETTNKAVKDALMNMALDRLSQAHRYYMKAKKIDELSMFFLEKLFCSYKSLDGNGHADNLMKDLRDLLSKSYV